MIFRENSLNRSRAMKIIALLRRRGAVRRIMKAARMVQAPRPFAPLVQP
jgi:hypothetical protein